MELSYQNRLVIKKLVFTKVLESYKQDIKIKLFHNSQNYVSNIFWNYPNNELINWKFIFIMDFKKPIDFMILDDELFNKDNLLGTCRIEANHFKLNKVDLEDFDFPEPIHCKIEIIKEDEVIGHLLVENYFIPEKLINHYKCGAGWNIPDEYPKLESFPF